MVDLGTYEPIKFELFNNRLLEADRLFYLNYYLKMENADSSSMMHIFILFSKFGELALKHKELILSKYIELIREQKELIGYYLRIMEAAAGNISPAGDITAIISSVVNFIQLGSLLTQLGTFQGDFRVYSEKPLLAYISEIAQRTESIRDDTLETAYDQLRDAVLLPDKIMR